jgi:oxygen-dependent protoporphyrinogen oxidase
MTSAERPSRVVIVGGGVAGLAAAFFLRGSGAVVTVLEGSPRIGGKLAVSEVAGIAVDAGAEALLARRPEGTALIAAIGLADQLVYPGTTTASIWSRGQFRALPRRQFMGVPAELDEVERSGTLSPDGMARARQDAERPATRRDGDVSVGAYVGARFGHELVDRLVDPLLGGVYAGRSDQLSFDATLPGLAAASRQHASLAEAAGAVLGPVPGTTPAPVFTTLAGGLGRLPDVLARASCAVVRTGAMARELARTADGWQLTVGSARAPEWIAADAVILALPARPASRLLGGVTGADAAMAARALGEIDYASMAIVTLAYPASAFGVPIAGSGYLVPAVDGRPVKAVTFSTVKWPQLAAASHPAAGGTSRPGGTDSGPPLHLVRCSVGRMGEESVLQRDDGDLVALAAADLAAATGVTGAPVDSRVTRWGGGLPQYTVGHLDRVRRIRDGVAALPGLAVCGAAYDGIGVPACIASARLAADRLLAHLEGTP